MNNERFVTTSDSPTVVIERADGNLAVSTGDEAQVWVRTNNEEYSVEHEDDRVVIRLTRNGQVTVPVDTTLIVQKAHGNVKIEQVEGDVTIERVHGNLALYGTGPIRIEEVSGNLTAKQVNGDISAERILGNATCHEIEGSVLVEACQGHLAVREVEGDVQSHVFGSANLRLAPQAGHTIAVDARGSIHCHIPTTTDSQVTLNAKGRVNVSHLPVPQPGNQSSFTLGEGTGRITLEAWGSVSLVGYTPGAEDEEGNAEFDYDFDFDFGPAEEIMRQFGEQMETQARELTRQFEARLADYGSGDELAAKVQEKVQKALRQAEEKIAHAARRAEEKANRKAARAERRGQRGRPGQGPMARHPMASGVVSTPPVPPVPPRPAAPGVSDEERMHILRMLEEGKISVDQAETLLAALEG